MGQINYKYAYYMANIALNLGHVTILIMFSGFGGIPGRFLFNHAAILSLLKTCIDQRKY
jgi:hypothetical protein